MTETIKADKRDFLKAAALVGAASSVLSASTGRPALAQMLETGVRDDSVLAKIRKEGVLRVGYAQTGPWFYKDAKTGELGGIYKDLVDQLCRELQIKPEYKEVTFANSTVGLRRGDYDLFGSSLTYTIQRALVVNYIGPIWSKGSNLLIHKDSADRFKTAADLNSEDVIFSVTGRERGAAHSAAVSEGEAHHHHRPGDARRRAGASEARAGLDERRQRRHPVRQAQQQLGRGGRSGEPDRPPAEHMGRALRG
ncbi:MAG TPA: transporter substrate-binding domain-containing protein [Beijerinckiaceae bacterium]|nr:transporter substrate-binding domain-containing protein [Beijerinckiaceae bacterium]